MNIDNMLASLLKAEGGYTNNPNDSGGETIWGITKATATSNGYSGSMRDMTKDQALTIYREQYYYKPGFALVADESPAVAGELFDTGVNMGVSTASTFFQRSLNALNGRGANYPDIKVDGQIGRGTVNAFAGLIAKRGHDAAESVMLKALNCLQGARYISLAEANPKNEEFLFGWLMNRVSISV
jgi:lysozyme family protein